MLRKIVKRANSYQVHVNGLVCRIPKEDDERSMKRLDGAGVVNCHSAKIRVYPAEFQSIKACRKDQRKRSVIRHDLLAPRGLLLTDCAPLQTSR
jgi:hypothetical protein